MEGEEKAARERPSKREWKRQTRLWLHETSVGRLEDPAAALVGLLEN